MNIIVNIFYYLAILFTYIEKYFSDIYKQITSSYSIILLIKNDKINNKIYFEDYSNTLITNTDFVVYECMLNDKLCHFFVNEENFNPDNVKITVKPFMSIDLFFNNVKYDLSSFKYYFFIENNEIYKKYQLVFYFKNVFNVDLDDSYYISILDNNVEMKEIKSSQYVLVKNDGKYEIKDL